MKRNVLVVNYLRIGLYLGAVLILLSGGASFAGGGPEGVAVVVNADSWASMAVANEYVRLRNIPPKNIIYLNPGKWWDFKSTDVDKFRDHILKPVLNRIGERGLAAQIDAIVYSSDVPYLIAVSKDMTGKTFKKPITSTASITGLTYMYRWTIRKQPGDPAKRIYGYLYLRSNWYYRQRIRARPSRPKLEDEQKKNLADARTLIRQEKWAEAEKLFRQLIKEHPDAQFILYDLACCLARQNKPDDAMETLTKAVKAGWSNRRHTETDNDFKDMRKRKDFKKLLGEIRSPKVGVFPPVGFTSRYGWNPAGQIVRNRRTGPSQGYVLSTVLAVTSGRGNSVSEAIRSLRRSAAADGTRPKGTIYFMVNSNVRSRVRQWGFDSVIAGLKALGVKAETVKGVLPSKRDDVMGVMVGSGGFNWPKSGCRILPGAICEHLTSYGGAMSQTSGQTACTEFIRYGAAGTCGTVSEPYAVQAKFPTPFMHLFYASGCSLAEAFYQTISGPYQLLIIGDPLCRPWAKIPTVTLADLKDKKAVKGEITLTVAVKEADIRIGRYELFIDGLRKAIHPAGKPFKLDTTKLSDGWHELRIIAFTADRIATQGHLVSGITVNNNGRKLKVTPKLALNIVPLGRQVPYSLSLPGAKKIGVYHNSRELAVVEGAKGDVKIDTWRIGMGTVRLNAVGFIEADGKTVSVAAAPIELTVEPPARLPGVKPPKGKNVVKGLLLTCKGGEKPAVVKDLRDRKALITAAVRKNQSFKLEAYFDVPSDDTYQFQVNFDGQLKIEVNGKKIQGPKSAVLRRWVYLPVSLKRGTHKFRATGRATKNLRLDIRFGGPGAFSLSEKRFNFRHVGKGGTGL